MALFGKKMVCGACGAKFGNEKELMEHNKVHLGSMGEGHGH